MPWLVSRSLPEDAGHALTRMLGEFAERLDDPALDRNDTVRSWLAHLLHARPYEELEEREPWAAFALDPRNVLFEAERYRATDPDTFARVKPLLWAWTQSDRTPFGASLASGVPLRRMLAERIFARVGRDLTVFPGVEFSVGYNLDVGDDVVLHRDVFIDDIGGVEIHDRASLSDQATVFSHSHAAADPGDVTLSKTVIGRGVRIAFRATVLAGTVLSDDSMLGALALATRSLDPHVVAVGIPARPHGRKDPTRDPGLATLAVDARRGPAPGRIRAAPGDGSGADGD